MNLEFYKIFWHGDIRGSGGGSSNSCYWCSRSGDGGDPSTFIIY